jgi:hypothetical protein
VRLGPVPSPRTRALFQWLSEERPVTPRRVSSFYATSIGERGTMSPAAAECSEHDQPMTVNFLTGL